MRRSSHLSGGPFDCCCGGSSGGGTTILVSRAESLTGVRDLAIFDDDFVVVPGTRGSYWRDLHATDCHIVNDYPGGVVQVASNSGYGGIVVDPFDGYPAIPSGGPSIIGTPDAANPFYMAVRFQLAPDPGGGGPGGWDDSHCSFVVGLVDPNNVKVMGIGLAIGDGFFGAVNGDLSNTTSLVGMPSLVARDLGVWHWAELYTTPATSKWWLKVDDGVPIDVTTMFPDGAVLGTPIVQIMTDDVLQPAINIDRVVYGARAANATALPALGAGATAPTGPGDTGLAVFRSSSQAVARTALGLVPGTDVQAYDAELAALAGLVSAADKIPYFTGVGAAALANFPAAARTLLAQTTQALQRQAMGVNDVGDLRNYAVGDAIALLGLTRPQVVVDESFNCQPGAANSVFNAMGGTLTQSTIGEGGWFTLTTGAGAAAAAATHNNQRNIAVTNPSTKRWYAAFLFAVSSAVNADTTLRLGIYDASLGTANGVFLGIHGGTDPTKFGFFESKAAVVAGVLSAAAVDLDVIHLARLWCDGAGNVYGSIDFESPQTFVTTVTTACMPHLWMDNGAGGGARAFSFGHALLITE